MWFTEEFNDRIGRIGPRTRQVQEYPLAAHTHPIGITAGPDGNVWFTETGADKIGRIDRATGRLTEYPIPTPLALPLRITTGPDSALWFTEFGASAIGRIDPRDPRVTEYRLSDGGTLPLAISAGPDGALWFTERGGVGRLDPGTHHITEYPVGIDSFGLAVAHDRSLWLTDQVGNTVRQVSLGWEHDRHLSHPVAQEPAVLHHHRRGRSPLVHGVRHQRCGPRSIR